MTGSTGLKYMRCLSITMFCLLIVLQSLAQAVPHIAAPAIQKVACDTVQNPSSDCPCMDDHESEQCDVSCSCCATIAVLPGRVTFHTPLGAEIYFPGEPPLLLPQVYLPIFVPPQNRSWSQSRCRDEENHHKLTIPSIACRGGNLMCAGPLQQPDNQGAFS